MGCGEEAESRLFVMFGVPRASPWIHGRLGWNFEEHDDDFYIATAWRHLLYIKITRMPVAQRLSKIKAVL
jgi:hypothetical protein